MEVQLTDSVAELAEREAELELIRAMTETTSKDSNESEIIKDLQLELSNLKSELASAKLADSTKEPNDDLKSQLEEAIADSFELQAQLEETQKRLAILEDSQNPSEELISEYVSIIEKAQEMRGKQLKRSIILRMHSSIPSSCVKSLRPYWMNFSKWERKMRISQVILRY